MRNQKTSGYQVGGGNPAANQKGKPMTVADLCLILGVVFALATLVVKIIEVARND